jgi:hypothetical protein
MVDVLRRVCASSKGCRWTWYLEADGADRCALFLARAGKRNRKHTQELVTLVGNAADMQFREFPNKKTLAKFLAVVVRVDARFTWLGICGR